MGSLRAAILCVAALIPICRAATPSSQADEPTARVLIDSVHANNYHEQGLVPDNYEYHSLNGFRWAFEHLKQNGVQIDEIKQGRLTNERLADVDMLFINLPSAEREPFYIDEISAIEEFVGQGGSLMVIVDHTNAYFHANRLAPLFDVLGLAVFKDTACDLMPDTLGTGNAWLAVTRFDEHPVTAGLECLGVQTGGPVDPKYGVAWTSPEAWADQWIAGPYGEEGGPAFYGNWRRDEGETDGPLAVVAALEYGKGRIVLVGDQNMLGDLFINYADNWRLWLNATAWLLREPSLRNAESYVNRRTPKVLLYEQYDDAEFGTLDQNAYGNAATLIGRYWWAMTSDRLDEDAAIDGWDLIVFAKNDYQLPDEKMAVLLAHLRAGRNVLFIGPADPLPWDESFNLINMIGKSLGEEAKRRCENGIEIIEFSTPGKIFNLVGKEPCFDNTHVPSATEAPSTDEQRRTIENLLNAVRRSIGHTQ